MHKLSKTSRILITIPPKLLELIDLFVQDGFYQNRGDLITNAIRFYLHHIRSDKKFIEDILVVEQTNSENPPED